MFEGKTFPEFLMKIVLSSLNAIYIVLSTILIDTMRANKGNYILFIARQCPVSDTYLANLIVTLGSAIFGTDACYVSLMLVALSNNEEFIYEQGL